MPKKPQYAKRAKILKYVKVGDKWSFANVVEERGKPVRDHVLVSGVEEHHPEGTYYIEWYEIGGRRRRQAVENFALLLEEARLKALHIFRNRIVDFRYGDVNPILLNAKVNYISQNSSSNEWLSRLWRVDASPGCESQSI